MTLPEVIFLSYKGKKVYEKKLETYSFVWKKDANTKNIYMIWLTKAIDLLNKYLIDYDSMQKCTVYNFSTLF